MEKTKNDDMKRILIFVLDVLVVSFVLFAMSRMVRIRKDGALVSGGLGAFKYYTVLSNVFCALSCLCSALCFLIRRKADLPSWLYVFRLMGSSVVSVTFLVVLFFLGLIYGYKQMFTGVSFWLHLVGPVSAIASQLLMKQAKPMPLRTSFWGIAPTVLYGVFYISVNAVQWTGESNPTTDFYRFLAWGWGIGVVIYLAIFLINWLVSLLYWSVGRKGVTEGNA
ncbi:MAG: hypothetical protein IKP61_02285 [Spirochaetales bacterium]|nr:hypothetical protein [Spirochaetales bacterium]